MSFSQTIYGQVVSKSNAYRISGNRLYKSAECRKYERDFAKQWTNKGMIKGDFILSMTAYMRDSRIDLDGCFKVILDSLQKAGAIENDRHCVGIIAFKNIDKDVPRIFIKLQPV